MSGYMLVWILLQKIEKLEEELNTYRKQTKTDLSVQSSSLPALFFLSIKKDMCLYTHTCAI